MDSNRRIAVIVGSLFILADVATLLGTSLTGPVFSDSHYLQNASGHASALKLGAVAEIFGALAVALIPAFLYPILRRFHEGIALGYLSIRIAEAFCVILSAVASLLLLSLSQSYVGASAAQAPSYAASGALVQGLNTWAFDLDPIVFGVGAMLFYYLLVRSRLVPAWLALWGLLGAVCVISAGLSGLFGSFGSLQYALAVPIAVQEMALAGWLIVVGFRSGAGVGDRRGLPVPGV